MKYINLGIMLGMGLFVMGCPGPKGDMGTSGGNGSATTTYSQNFDGAGYTPSSQWSATTGMGVSLDTSTFLSAGAALKISTTTGALAPAAAYTNANVVPAYTSRDYYVDFYWRLTNLSASGTLAEATLVNGTTVKAVFGYDTTNNRFYTYNNGVTLVLMNGLNAGAWYHVIMISHSNGTADYFINGNLDAQNVPNNTNLALTGAPASTLAFNFPSGLTAGSSTNIDNVTVYHY